MLAPPGGKTICQIDTSALARDAHLVSIRYIWKLRQRRPWAIAEQSSIPSVSYQECSYLTQATRRVQGWAWNDCNKHVIKVKMTYRKALLRPPQSKGFISNARAAEASSALTIRLMKSKWGMSGGVSGEGNFVAYSGWSSRRKARIELTGWNRL